MPLSGKAKLTLEPMGSESGFSHSFKAGGGAVTATKNSSFTAWGAVPIGTLNYNAAAITGWLFTSSGGARNKGIGTQDFGIFLQRGFQGGGNY